MGRPFVSRSRSNGAHKDFDPRRALLTTDGFAIYYGRKEDVNAVQGKTELE